VSAAKQSGLNNLSAILLPDFKGAYRVVKKFNFHLIYVMRRYLIGRGFE